MPLASLDSKFVMCVSNTAHTAIAKKHESYMLTNRRSMATANLGCSSINQLANANILIKRPIDLFDNGKAFHTYR